LLGLGGRQLLLLMLRLLLLLLLLLLMLLLLLLGLSRRHCLLCRCLLCRCSLLSRRRHLLHLVLLLRLLLVLQHLLVLLGGQARRGVLLRRDLSHPLHADHPRLLARPVLNHPPLGVDKVLLLCLLSVGEHDGPDSLLHQVRLLDLLCRRDAELSLRCHLDMTLGRRAHLDLLPRLLGLLRLSLEPLLLFNEQAGMLVHLRLAVSVPRERELVHRLRIVWLSWVLLQMRGVGLLSLVKVMERMSPCC